MLDLLKRKGRKLKDLVTDYSCVHIIWMISLMPKIGGFPLFTEKISVLFWLLHISLAAYVYIVGVIYYQMYFSEGLVNTVSSVFNVLLLIIVLNNTFWFLLKKREVNNVLKLTLASDALVTKEGRFLDNYSKLMMKTKLIIAICYTFHFVNDVLVFIPSRAFDMESYPIVSCVGLNISATPSREICMIMLAMQELTSIVVVGGYDLIFIFLFSHTTVIFLMLSKDMDSFSKLASELDDSVEMKNVVNLRLRNLAIRHSLVLLTVINMQNLFSTVILMVLAVNTVSVCTFFVLPLEVASTFVPLICYTLTVIFFYCLLGQRLINASVDFEMAVYSNGWENLDVREQKVVFSMLIRAQQPVVVCAADMVPICMATFATILQAIYRFVTVFRF